MATYKQIEAATEQAYEDSLKSGEGYRKRLPKFFKFLASRRLKLNGGPELLATWRALTTLVWHLGSLLSALGYYVVSLPLAMLCVILSPISIFIFDTIRVHQWEREAEALAADEEGETWADEWIAASRAERGADQQEAEEARQIRRLPRREDYVQPDEIED